MGPGGPPFRQRLRSRLGGPSLLGVVVVAPAFWLGTRLGIVAPVSIWVLLGLLLGAQLVAGLAYALWGEAQDGWRLWARVGLELAVITAVMYSIGWGPTLSIGLVFGTANNVRAGGSRAALPSLVWSVIDIGLGELAIWLGIAPSLISQPLVHGLALFACLGTVLTILLFGWATSDKERAEEALERREERFRGMVQHAADIILVLDAGGVVQYASPAFEATLGFTLADAIGASVLDFAHPDDVEQAAQSFAAVDTEGVAARVEVRLRHRDGRWLWFDASVTDMTNRPGVEGIVTNLRDITERKAIAEQLADAATRDGLTRLPNRVALLDGLAEMLRTRGRGKQIGIIFLDLDRFKVVNDSMGHPAGDELLCKVAQRLREVMRSGDTVARFGGDEFVVLCANLDRMSSLLEIAQRVADTIARPTVISGREVLATASLGVLLSRGPDDSPDQLLQDADTAMYRAKDNGRARIEVFDEHTHRQADEALQLDVDLHRAVQRREFELHYQPIVDLTTGRVDGFEALIRWRHPTRGLIEPDQFISHAEDTGLIVPIGAWALEEACRQTAHWQAQRVEAEALRINVNLAPRQLLETDFVESVDQIMDRTGIHAGSLWLELTEHALMREPEQAISVLGRLRSLGVHLAVDDFGTGYSSLAYLKRFPVDALKVDQSFVDGLERDVEDTSIVRAVIGLAHSLDLVAIAEGLETDTQLAVLRTMGCDYAQGFLFGAPRPAYAIGDRPADDLRAWHTGRFQAGGPRQP